MKITAQISSVDYDAIIENALPKLKEKKDSNAARLLSGILNMPGGMPVKMISALPRKTKDEIVASVINSQKDKFIQIITESLAEKGYPVEISDIEVTL